MFIGEAVDIEWPWSSDANLAEVAHCLKRITESATAAYFHVGVSHEGLQEFQASPWLNILLSTPHVHVDVVYYVTVEALVSGITCAGDLRSQAQCTSSWILRHILDDLKPLSKINGLSKLNGSLILIPHRPLQDPVDFHPCIPDCAICYA